MTPNFPSDDAINSVIGDSIFLSELGTTDSFFGMFPSYLKNLFFGQFGFIVIFSKRMSSLLNFLGSILLIGSCAKMFFSNAGPIIAGMKNMETSRNSSILENVSDSMGIVKGSTDNNLSISASIKRTNPVPASIRFLNGFPESVFHSIDVVSKDVFHGFNVHGAPFKSGISLNFSGFDQ